MKRCIIHVGMHKTGSTSIQRSLAGFRDERFLYASLDMPNHSLAMYSLFAPRPEKHHLHGAMRPDSANVAAYTAERRAELEKSIAAAKHRTLIVSGEDISVLPPDALARMRDYFRAHFDDVTVAGYIRPPCAFMASGFQQRVKSGSVVQIRPESEYRQYRRHFGALDDIFGRENVHLWKFDPGVFPGNCVVRDFCARMGIALPPRRIVRLNESLSRQAVALLFTYRRYIPKCEFPFFRAPEGQRLGALLAATGDDRFRFSPELVKPILEKNRADIEWMEARLGQSLDEDLGDHRPGDVLKDADLLKPDPATVDKLLALLGRAAPKDIRGETPEEVARLVHALRMKHAGRETRSSLGRIGVRIRTALRLRG